MKTLIYSLVICVLLGLLTMAGGCAGCSHRHRRAAERHRERAERRDRDEVRESRNKEDVASASFRGIYSEGELQALASGSDYDAMLNAMFSQLKELKRLKNEYFKGDMADKEAERRMEEINKRYAPIQETLSKATSEGELNYNQHKKQIKLFGEYQQLIVSIMARIGSDLSHSF